MGRPFADEVEELEEAYSLAQEFAVEPLSRFITQLEGTPLIAVGSGGSLTTATVFAELFRRYSLGFSTTVTPLGLVSHRSGLRNAGVFLATAGGSNPDVIGAMRIAAGADARLVLALCASTGSRLSAEAAKFSNVHVEEFETTSGKDGFLATNSLWASVVFLTRAFAANYESSLVLPKRLPGLVGARRWSSFVSAISAQADLLWERGTTIVLHGSAGHPAAVDLESKLTEAALSNVWIADYRHFAHGRHHWLAKRGEQSSVIAFVGDKEAVLAQKTLEKLPKSVPQLVVRIPDGALGIITALLHVFPVVLSAGKSKGIDPGRPGVPPFGRKIYHLNAFSSPLLASSEIPTLEAIAIERKSGNAIQTLEQGGSLSSWRSAYLKAVHRIRDGRYRAIVFDYDGTLCDSADRFRGLRKEVGSQLCRLLQCGLLLGIATGRGKSVREALQAIVPKKYWSKVIVGYYNGSQIGTLKDESIPDGSPDVELALTDLYSALKSSHRIKQIARIEGRLRQISIVPLANRDASECWNLLTHQMFLQFPGQFKLVRSSHSFDVIPLDVSKIAVLRRLSDSVESADVLALGDMGGWPGNDHELLAHQHSISVDQVSPDLDAGWNFASPGVRGVKATLQYLAAVSVNKRCLAKIALPHGRMRSER